MEEPVFEGLLSAAAPAAQAAAATGLGWVAGAKTANTTINDTVTYTTGGVTYAAPALAAGQVYRVKAWGTFTTVSSGTGRNMRVACFWGSTQLPEISVNVASSQAVTDPFQVEFILVGSSTTAIWTVGQMIEDLQSVNFGSLFLDASITGSTTVTSGAQTLDIRFSMSVAVATDFWTISQVIMERLQ
jgi:hypothetical protein